MEGNKVSVSLGLPTILTIVFVVLKLCNVIDWSWWWVLSPLWISLALGIVVIVVCLIAALILAGKY